LVPPDIQRGTVREVEVRGDPYETEFLSNGEMVMLVVPGAVFGPSELERFIAELKAIQGRLIPAP
jgi:hypothetical protein